MISQIILVTISILYGLVVLERISIHIEGNLNRVATSLESSY